MSLASPLTRPVCLCVCVCVGQSSELETAGRSVVELRTQLTNSANRLSSAECAAGERQTALEEARRQLASSGAELRQLSQQLAERTEQLQLTDRQLAENTLRSEALATEVNEKSEVGVTNDSSQQKTLRVKRRA